MSAGMPHVALLIETSRSYGRGVLRGIRRYVSEHGPWSTFMERRALDSRTPPWLRSWRGDGILTRTGSRAMAEAIRKVGVPTVELRSPRLNPQSPWVGVDNRAMGEMIVDHLYQRGFRRFGVFEIGTEPFFEERRNNFVETLARRGCQCSIFHSRGHPERPAQWERRQCELVEWITRLAKPVGVMACTDQLGFFLLDACARAGISVPEQVAVVGVENDESLCLMANPPLSSVRFDLERVGYEAAAMLDRMMAGQSPSSERILIKPLGIATRQSSDIVAIEDKDLASAMRFIRERACCTGISVQEVADHVAVSRSALERRMRATLGTSPKAEINRIRFNHVRELLATTDLSLVAIARRTGFRHVQYLVESFKRAAGQTPGAYRNAKQHT